MAAPAIIIAPLVWFTIREPRLEPGHVARKADTLWSDLKWLGANPAFVFVFLAGAFNGIGIQGVGIFTPSFLMREHHLSIANTGAVVGLFGVMGLIGTFVGGVMADRFADSRGRSYVLVPALGAGLSLLLFAIAYRVDAWPVAIALLLAGNIATDLKNGPKFAAVQNIVPSNMRATAAAMFFMAATVVGTGAGAALVGGLSDLAAARAFPADLGAFAQMCPGGRAAAQAAAGLAEACAGASAQGLRTSLGILPVAFLGATICFFLASRTIRVNTD